jgi:transposase
VPCYAGLDCSKHTTSICVLGPDGETLREAVVESAPAAIIEFLRRERRRYVRIGLEAWTLAPWLYAALIDARLPAICIEAHHAHGVLKARLNKTDKNDARGIAEMMRAGLYKAVHVKSLQSQRTRAFFTIRQTLLRKRIDLENSIRGTLLQFGHKLRPSHDRAFENAVRSFLKDDSFLEALLGPLLRLRNDLIGQVRALNHRLRSQARADPVCRRFMTAPGVGPLTALAVKTAIDEAGRFARSRDVGPCLGLTARTRQSGLVERRGRISRFGDSSARSQLFIAARVILRRGSRPNSLRRWGERIAARRGRGKATVAVARRLAVILHRMWIDGSDFRWDVGEEDLAASSQIATTETILQHVMKPDSGQAEYRPASCAENADVADDDEVSSPSQLTGATVAGRRERARPGRGAAAKVSATKLPGRSPNIKDRHV